MSNILTQSLLPLNKGISTLVRTRSIFLSSKNNSLFSSENNFQIKKSQVQNDFGCSLYYTLHTKKKQVKNDFIPFVNTCNGDHCYSDNYSLINSLYFPRTTQFRSFSTSRSFLEPEKNQKNNKIDDKKKNPSNKISSKSSKSLKQKIIDECSHYYYGTKLFFLDVKVASRYIRKMINGKVLTVREKNQLERTLVDMCRIVPFLALILIPFAEFALPFIIKIFPGFLPSSFQGHHRTKMDIVVQKLKMDLEYRSVMYKEIEKYHFKPGDNKSQRFARLIDEVRAGRRQLHFKELIKFSQYLTEDDLAEILTSEQLQQLLKQNLLEFNNENTINYFDEKAQQKLQDIQNRDYTLLSQISSGFSNLNHDQLVEECSSRGIQHKELPDDILRQKLHRWIHFSANKNVPVLFLLITRIHESEDSSYISNVFKSLPERLLNELEINIADDEGEEVSHETMYDIIKDEEEILKNEADPQLPSTSPK